MESKTKQTNNQTKNTKLQKKTNTQTKKFEIDAGETVRRSEVASLIGEATCSKESRSPSKICPQTNRLQWREVLPATDIMGVVPCADGQESRFLSMFVSDLT